MRKSTTAKLFLFLLAMAQQTAVANSPSRKTSSLGACSDIVAMPDMGASAFRISEVASFTATSNHYSATPESIKKYLVGEIQYCESIVEQVNEIRNHDPYIADYVDFVFNHLENFHIIISNVEEIKHYGNKFNAEYDPNAKSIIIPGNMNDNMQFAFEINTSITALRHEFRHAFWNTIQILYNAADSNSVNCFLPDSEVNYTKIQEWLELGDKRVEELKALLQQEAVGTLSNDSKKKLLKDLRDKSKEAYSKYYGKSVVISITKADLSNYQAKGIKFRVGNIINVDALQPKLLGDIKILHLLNEEDGNSRYYVQLLDPLYGLCLAHSELKKSLLHYSITNRQYEQDAYLYEKVPVSLIGHFYKEFHTYERTILQQAKANSNLKVYSVAKTSFWTPIDVEKANCRFTMRDANSNAIDKASQILQKAEFCINANLELDFIEQALKMLVAQGVEKAQSNHLLGCLYFKEKNTKEAYKYFRRAIKQGAVLLAEDYAFYGYSLLDNQFYKDAESSLKVAHKMVTEALKAEINPNNKSRLQRQKEDLEKAIDYTQTSMKRSLRP